MGVAESVLFSFSNMTLSLGLGRGNVVTLVFKPSIIPGILVK
jgi:hypothetical protein